jgi:hypothetical protein
MSSKLNLRFCNIGLPLDHSSIPEDVREKVRKGMDATLALYARVNCSMDCLFVTPEEMHKVVAYLQSHPQLSGVVLGFGVRGNPDLTVFFEETVQAVREHAPQARLIFNTRPDDSLQAIQRSFPQVKVIDE